jgi:hypothetical protein
LKILSVPGIFNIIFFVMTLDIFADAVIMSRDPHTFPVSPGYPAVITVFILVVSRRTVPLLRITILSVILVIIGSGNRFRIDGIDSAAGLAEKVIQQDSGCSADGDSLPPVAALVSGLGRRYGEKAYQTKNHDWNHYFFHLNLL